MKKKRCSTRDSQSHSSTRPGSKKFKIKKLPKDTLLKRKGPPPRDHIMNQMKHNIKSHLKDVMDKESRRLLREQETLLEIKSSLESKIIQIQTDAGEKDDIIEELGNQIHRQSELKDFFAKEVGNLKVVNARNLRVQRTMEEKIEKMEEIIEKLSRGFEKLEQSSSTKSGKQGGYFREFLEIG